MTGPVVAGRTGDTKGTVPRIAVCIRGSECAREQVDQDGPRRGRCERLVSVLLSPPESPWALPQQLGRCRPVAFRGVLAEHPSRFGKCHRPQRLAVS